MFPGLLETSLETKNFNSHSGMVSYIALAETGQNSSNILGMMEVYQGMESFVKTHNK